MSARYQHKPLPGKNLLSHFKANIISPFRIFVKRETFADKIKKLISKTRKSMESAVKELDFLEAARLRDELLSLHELLESKKD